VTFRHPLVRSAAYRAASPAERRAAHEALAAATDPRADPERRAWHRAHAAPGPDEEVAAELERSAGRAQARGGLAAAAAFLERSAALTADPACRADRALAAARATCQAGSFDAALELLATAAEARPADPLRHARSNLLRGQVAFASGRGSDAPPLLVQAARQFEPLDPRLARETYLDALAAAIFAGRLAPGGGIREVAEAARVAPPSPGPARAPDLLLDGLALLICEGYPAGVPVLRRAVSAFRDPDLPAEEGLRWLWLACRAAWMVWDYDSWDVLSDRQVGLARDAGALIALPVAFNVRSGARVFAGDFTEAASVVAQAGSVTEATGSSIAPYGALALAVFRGRETEAAQLIQTAGEVGRRGEGAALTFAGWANAVLCNSLGRYEEALAAARQASDDFPSISFASWALVELVEAAARSGAPECAGGALRRLSGIARACGTDWALGAEARARALVSDGAAAESLYREAVDRFGHTRLRVDLARAHLVYGEWLRRQRRRREARDQLASAYRIFDSIGAAAFAERARIELRASGGQARERAVQTRDPLTAQEALIARLAGEGASNPEIAAQLFISRATVAYHLRKVYAKLDISSRTQLAPTLPAQDGPPAATGTADSLPSPRTAAAAWLAGSHPR
jgi:DNA-binding CsgD family transcriptional regulator